MLGKLDELDKKAETMLLTSQEVKLKHVLNKRLAELLREEKLKWYQRAKTRDLLEGDANTKYFWLMASGKYRKIRIFQLGQEEGVIFGDTELKNISLNITITFLDLPVGPLCRWASHVVMTSHKSRARKMNY